MEHTEKLALQRRALEIRIGVIEALKARGFGHIGGSLSIADALAVLYFSLMDIRPDDPAWPQRDKLVCSKGHAGPAVYAALALRGYFPYGQLRTLNQPGTSLPSHCDHSKTPGVDMTTGSLGQGASLAAGQALGDRLLGRPSRTFLIVGDGELDEGQVWEAAMFTAAKKLTGLTWLVDSNKKQLDGPVDSVLPLFDIRAKFEAFGFEAREVDGHDVEALHEALGARPGEKPLAVVLNTVKGKGIPAVEETAANHSMNLTADVCDGWLAALRASLAAIA